MELRLQIRKLGDYPGLSGQIQCNHGGLEKWASVFSQGTEFCPLPREAGDSLPLVCRKDRCLLTHQGFRLLRPVTHFCPPELQSSKIVLS